MTDTSRLVSVRGREVYPGCSVIIRGVSRMLALNGIVVHVHEPGVMMTMPDGEEREWRGERPIVDIIIVDRISIPSDDPEKIPGTILDPNTGEVKRVTKVASELDLAKDIKFKLLPPGLLEVAPRYLVVSKVDAG